MATQYNVKHLCIAWPAADSTARFDFAKRAVTTPTTSVVARRWAPVERTLGWGIVAGTVLFGVIVASQWIWERIQVTALVAREEARARQTDAQRTLALNAAAPVLLLQQVLPRPDAVARLTELHRLLPSDAYAIEVDVRAPDNQPATFELMGLSPNPRTLVEDMRKDPYLQDVELKSTAAGFFLAKADRMTLAGSWAETSTPPQTPPTSGATP